MLGLGWQELIVLLFLVGLYLSPMLIAWGRDHPNLVAITALNLLLGWTLLGWVAAIVWALASFSRADEADDDERKPCPFCAEAIRPEAILCPHCRSDLRRQAPEKERDDERMARIRRL